MRKVIIVGGSGVGKTTLANTLRQKSYRIERSYTTRPKREDESPMAYHFVSTDQFSSMQAAGHFLQMDSFGGQYYGTHDFEWQSSQVHIWTAKGVNELSPVEMLNHDVMVVHLTATIKVLKERGVSASRIQRDRKDKLIVSHTKFDTGKMSVSEIAERIAMFLGTPEMKHAYNNKNDLALFLRTMESSGRVTQVLSILKKEGGDGYLYSMRSYKPVVFRLPFLGTVSFERDVMNHTIHVDPHNQDADANVDWSAYGEFTTSFLRTFDHKELGQEVYMAMGLSEEASEVSSMIRKKVFYGKKYSKAQWLDEFGDVAWYLRNAMQLVGITMTEVIEANKAKLLKRYGTTAFDASKAANPDKEAEIKAISK